MGRITAVIFDMDGLMVDTERMSREFRRQAMEERGIPFRDLIHLVMGRNDREVRAVYREQYGEDYPYDEIRDGIRRRWREYLSDHPVPVKPGLFPLLDCLRDHGIPMAVATSTSRASASRTLEQGGIAPYLSAMAFGDMVERSKPEPDIFLLAARLLGAEPAGCLVLEDSPNGILAAHRAGMMPVMIPDLAVPTPELEKILYGRFDRLDQVIMLIEGRNSP